MPPLSRRLVAPVPAESGRTVRPAKPPRLARLLVLILVAAFALLPLDAQATNDTPTQAVLLSAGSPSAADTLLGHSGGAYRFYRVSYPGGDQPVLFTLSYRPDAGGASQAFGLNLYGPSGQTFAGQTTGSSGGVTTVQVTLANPSAMDLLVQVYNYANGIAISYTLSASGLTGGGTEHLVARNNNAPSRAINVTGVNAVLGGSIVGNPAGAFQYYTLHYPGGNTPMTISMNASPAYPGELPAYGFNVYRVRAGRPAELVARGVTQARDASSATLSATVIDRASGTYQLQVENYWPGVPVNYGVHLTGQATAPVPAQGNRSSTHPNVLTSARMGATESLVGNAAGSFDYFRVTWPGSGSPLAISVTYASLAGIPSSNVGFDVWDGSTLLATVHPSPDANGVMAATWTYPTASTTSPSAQPLLVQVFNYAPGTRVTYTIDQVGAR